MAVIHHTLSILRDQLLSLIAQIKAVVPNEEPLSIGVGSWNVPGLTRSEFTGEAQSLIEQIEELDSEDLGQNEARLKDYGRRLEFLRVNTVGQLWGGNGGQATAAYMLTLDGLRKALAATLTPDAHLKTAAKLRKIAVQVRAMEARLNGLEPRTTTIQTMVERIESAYEAADRLPTDLESLSESRQEIADVVSSAKKEQGHLFGIVEHADQADADLRKISTEAAAVLQRCEQAYSASTSVGLAAAFSERSEDLSKSMWIWVGGLITALIAGSYFGSKQLHSLSELFKTPNAPSYVVLLNLILSIFAVAAPVWFSWLATKQIGQRFRLSEDYAFKASVSRAYEGYRQEAHRIDPDLESRLLESALSRLDEQPLRLVESDSHGSPWHELLSSEAVKQALRSVPGFAQQVKAQADAAITLVRPSKEKSKLITSDAAD